MIWARQVAHCHAMPSSLSLSVLHMDSSLPAHPCLCTQHRNSLGNHALMVPPSYAIMWNSSARAYPTQNWTVVDFSKSTDLKMPRGSDKNTNFQLRIGRHKIWQDVTLISLSLHLLIDALHRRSEVKELSSISCLFGSTTNYEIKAFSFVYVARF
jgi:hypothetical protein